MPRIASVSIAVVIFACLLTTALPLGLNPSMDRTPPSDTTATSLSSLLFPGPINTSASVKEFPLIARALMLPGGATDATLADLNGDGLTDLIVSVYAEQNVSIFYREGDGSFPSYPSVNITTQGLPLAVMPIDVFDAGVVQILVLERKAGPFDSDCIEIFNYSDPTHYMRFIERQPPQDNVSSFTVGWFNSDTYPDIAVTCAGTDPDSIPGRVEIAYGPRFTLWQPLAGGLGTNSIASADFNSDGLVDIAVANRFDSSVLVYYQPFSDLMPANVTIAVTGQPESIASGNLNGDSNADIVVASEGDLHFYYQYLVAPSQYGLPSAENEFRHVAASISEVAIGDLNGDSRDDLLALSYDESAAYGFYQSSSGPVWSASPSFATPTQEGPRGSLIGSLDGDSSTEVAILAARSDGSGSSLGIYPAYPALTNSNMTVWTDPAMTASISAAGDLNGDGSEDLVVLFSSAGQIQYSIGGAGFSTISLGYSPGKMIVSDLNDDTYSDILVAETATPNIHIYFGADTLPGPFRTVTLSCGTSDAIRDIVSSDFNADWLPDIAVAMDSGKLELFYNDGTWTNPFPDRLDYTLTPGVPIRSIIAGDFDSNNVSDIAFSDGASGMCKIGILLATDADPSIDGTVDLNLSTSVADYFDRLWAGDLDGDGTVDIAAMRPSAPLIYMFDQEDFWSSPGPYSVMPLPETPGYISVVDATDDGLADVLAVFPSTDLLFLYRQDSGTIPETPSMTFVTGAGPDFVMFGDLTGDRRPDLVVTDSASHALSVWERFNFPPRAVIDGPFAGIEGDQVPLVAEETAEVSERTSTLYRWTFGDGNESGWLSIPSTNHIYAEEGNYTVVLEVQDPAGLTNSSSSYVLVRDSSPVADFMWYPAAPVEGQSVLFTDLSTSWDSITRINWSVDGVVIDSGLNHSISRVFDNGTYSIGLEIVDEDGSLTSKSAPLTVSRAAPSAVIHADGWAWEGDSVDFTVSVDPWHSGPWENIVSYEWNFSYSGAPFMPDAFTGTVNHTTHVFHTLLESQVYTVAVLLADSDGDQRVAFFNITIEGVTSVSLKINSTGSLYEIEPVSLYAEVDSAFPATLYEWAFDSDGGGTFSADQTTLTPEVVHTFPRAGNFLVKVRVTVSNDEQAIGSVFVSILDVPLSGTQSDMAYERNETMTNILYFDASALAYRCPDIVRTIWSFGDGVVDDSFGPPSGPVRHLFVPDRDYTVWLNVTDDEGNHLNISRTIKLSAPIIELMSPYADYVIKNGTVVRFSISDDNPPLVEVQYSVDGSAYWNFTEQWAIETANWSEGDHTVRVVALDRDGNIASSPVIVLTVDHSPPSITLLIADTSVFGGSKMNISVKVEDPNTADNGVILHLQMPGDTGFQTILMTRGPGGDVYYYVIDVPQRSGDLKWYVEARDLAGNSAQSDVQSTLVKLRFMDKAWPYLLMLAAATVLGTVAYFVREEKIAVDETFVIYNDGRLIAHSTRRLKPGMDDHVLSGMLVAIQDFVKDSFKDVTSFTLRKLEFGEKSVLIEKGEHLFLAVILHGAASKKVAAKMQAIVSEIEGRFGEHLADWDGDLDKVRGVSDSVKKLYSKAPLLPGPFKRT